MHDRHHQKAARQNRTGAEIPPERVLAVALLKVGLPEQGSLEVERGQCSALEVDIDARSVGHWRRVAAAATTVTSGALLAQFRLPQLFAGRPLKADGAVKTVGPLAGSGGQHDALTPDEWRRTALAGQGRFP